MDKQSDDIVSPGAKISNAQHPGGDPLGWDWQLSQVEPIFQINSSGTVGYTNSTNDVDIYYVPNSVGTPGINDHGRWIYVVTGAPILSRPGSSGDGASVNISGEIVGIDLETAYGNTNDDPYNSFVSNYSGSLYLTDYYIDNTSPSSNWVVLTAATDKTGRFGKSGVKYAIGSTPQEALNDYTNFASTTETRYTAPVSHAPADLTGNGTSDVLLQNGGTVADWIMQNGQYAGGNILSTAAAGWTVVGTGDFTGSGTSDVLLQNGGTVVDWIMQNGHYQTGNILTTAAAGWTVVGTGDLNGDGTDDVLLQNGGTVVDWVMKNGAYQSGNILTTAAAGWTVVGTGDLNGDGTNDVLLQNGGTVVDWVMRNGAYQSGNILTTAAAGWTVVGTGDYTGDGTDDVLLQNGGTVVDWVMKNGAYQSGNTLTTNADGWPVVGTGDYNGDGTADILFQNGGTVDEWLMKDGAFQSSNILTTGATGWRVVNGQG